MNFKQQILKYGKTLRVLHPQKSPNELGGTRSTGEIEVQELKGWIQSASGIVTLDGGRRIIQLSHYIFTFEKPNMVADAIIVDEDNKRYSMMDVNDRAGRGVLFRIVCGRALQSNNV